MGRTKQFDDTQTGEFDVFRPTSTKRRPVRKNTNRLTMWEVVGTTSTLLLVGAVAMGWFDVMIPWSGR